MKKTLLTMLCASAMFAASAATLSATSGTTFSGLTAGDAFSASGAAAEGGKYYWYSADAQSGANMALAANYYGGACGRPNMFADAETSAALALDADNLLYRAAEGAATAFSSPSFTQVDLGDGGLYIDTLVRFDYCRDDADIADDAGKLAVWLNSATQLVITAGKTVDNAFITNNYVVATLGGAAATFSPDDWYRLTIKAVPSDGKIAFNVYVDGKLAADGNSVDAFPSLVPSATQLSSIAMQGIGAVDDISFTEALPNFLGVASIGDTYYPTLDAAVSAAGANATIKLAADNAENITLAAAGKSFSIDTNGHTYSGTISAANEYALSSSTSGGVTTYTHVAGVAGVSVDGTSWTWYSTFEAAYAAAIIAPYQPDLKIKVDSDFVPTFPNVDSLHEYLWSIEFISMTDDPIAIALTDGINNMISSKTIKFPANATLTAISQELISISGGGTLAIPDDVTLATTSDSTFNGISSIVGSGTIIAPTNPRSFIENTKVQGFLKANTWTGTVQLSGVVDAVWRFSDIGNANSTICFNGLTTYLYTGTHSVGTVELIGDGLTINGQYALGTWTFPGTLTGSGALNVSIENSSGTELKSVVFTGDATGFGGSIAFGANANAYVQFGSTGVDSSELAAKRIITADDAVVTVASGKTWSSSNFMLHGNVTLNGNLRAIDGSVGLVWNNHNSAVLTVNAANAFQFGNYTTWTGRYVVNYDPNNDRAAFILPTSENASTVINGVAGAFTGYPSTGSATPTIYGSIVLNANWTIGDGWASDDKVTGFASLSGSGNLIVNGAPGGWTKIYYSITTLDNYTGTLGGNRGGFTIGKVNMADMPTTGACVVKTSIGAYGSINNDVPLYVNNVDTGKTLVYKADGANGAGLYLDNASNPTVDGNEVDAAVVFDTATSEKPITYPGEVTVSTNGEGEVSIAYSGTTVGVPEYYDVSVETEGDNKVVSLSLNEKAVPEVGAGTDKDDNLVEPMTVTPSSATVTLGITTSNTKLYYGIAYATSVDAEYTPPAVLTQGTGAALTIRGGNGEMPQGQNVRYFKLYVTDVPPAGGE